MRDIVGSAESSTHRVAGGGGLELRVKTVGPERAPAIVFVHGWSQNHLCWRNQLESVLAAEFRLVAVDLRGHGMSAQPLDAAAYQDAGLWAADIAAVIDDLGLHRPVLVVWSYGGLIACDYIRAYGQHAISGINFVGAAVTMGRRPQHLGPEYLRNAPGACVDDIETNVDAVRRFASALTVEPLESRDRDTLIASMMSVPREVRAALLSRQVESDDLLPRLSVPVLVSHGRRDAIVLPTMAEHVLDRCPVATASWYDHCGHAPFVEQPARFNRELARFVRQTDAQ